MPQRLGQEKIEPPGYRSATHLIVTNVSPWVDSCSFRHLGKEYPEAVWVRDAEAPHSLFCEGQTSSCPPRSLYKSGETNPPRRRRTRWHRSRSSPGKQIRAALVFALVPARLMVAPIQPEGTRMLGICLPASLYFNTMLPIRVGRQATCATSYSS